MSAYIFTVTERREAALIRAVFMHESRGKGTPEQVFTGVAAFSLQYTENLFVNYQACKRLYIAIVKGNKLQAAITSNKLTKQNATPS